MAEKNALTIDKIATATLGQTAAAIGQDEFYQRLLDAVGCCVPHDMSAIMRYSSFSQPDLLLGSDYGPEFPCNYARDLYRFDPFYRYWKEVARPGVVSLRDVVIAEADRLKYISTVLSDVCVTDEIAIFLPPVGRSSLALFLDRCGGSYGHEDTAKASLVYDLVAGLHTAHVNAVFGRAPLDGGGAGALLSGPQPTRILDGGGHEIMRNVGWSAYEGQHEKVLGAALAQLTTAGHVRIGSDLVLHRTTLPVTFHLAPCGTVETIEPLGLTPLSPDELLIPESMGRLLSRREQDIVGLMLRGYPTKTIAGRLGLTQGTVKNYRRRIYDKLDVTTEREVLLTCISGRREVNPSAAGFAGA